MNNLCFSPNILRVIKLRIMKLMEHIIHVEETRNEYRMLVIKSEGKGPLQRPRYRL
jgi:hypothetical protein